MNRLLKTLILTGITLLSVVMFVGCHTENPGGSGDNPGGNDPGGDEPAVDSTKSVFVLSQKDFPSQVDVTIDGAALYAITLSYDKYNRLIAYCKKYSDDIVENAIISHKSNTEAQVEYQQMGVSSTLAVRVSSGHLVWSYSNMSNANRYAVLLDSSRWPSQYEYNVQYTGKKYSNLIPYKTGFTYTDGNLVSEENLTATTSTASVKTVCSSAPDVMDKVTYSDKTDNANLGAFILAGEFLPWYMKGIPGNKRLVSKIEHLCCERTLAEYEEINYEEKDGKISRMTVDYYSGSNILHTKDYKIRY